MSEDGGWNGGRAGPIGPCRRPCKLGGFRPGRREVPPHQEVLGYTVAATLEHQRSGRMVAMEVGGAANLGGLTPPTLSAPHPLPPVPPRWASQWPWRGAACKAGWNLGCAQASSCWDARARLHACAHAHALWAQSGPCTCSIAQPGIHGKLEHGGVRPCACVLARECWPHALAHTRCAPCTLTQLLRGDSPKETHLVVIHKPGYVCDVACACFANFQRCSQRSP